MLSLFPGAFLKRLQSFANMHLIPLILAPTRGPANLRAVRITSTTIYIAWDPVPCSHRNVEITGYKVTLHTLHNGYLQKSATTSQERLESDHLLPGTTYNLIVSPVHSLRNVPQSHSKVELKTSISKGSYVDNFNHTFFEWYLYHF